MLRPHGGSLTNNFIDLSRIDKDLFTIDMDIGLKKEIENISFGVFSPLKGFMNEEDFTSVVKKGRLANDLPWTIPVILDANEELAKKVKDSSQVALRNNGQIFGVMQVEELYKFDKTKSAKSVFQTDDPSHPGFNKFVTMHDILIAGDVKIVNTHNNKFLDRFRLTPTESRKEIEDQGWKSTVGVAEAPRPHRRWQAVCRGAARTSTG
jgi:sulfate adenylyltransferase